MTVPDWQHALTTQVAGNIEHHRHAAGLSRAALAAHCTALGLPTKRPALAALLDGRRQTVTLQELLVLAEALDTSLAELLLPLHTGGPALSAPDRAEHAFTAAVRLFALAADGDAASAPAYRPFSQFVRAADRFTRANRRLIEISHAIATGAVLPHQADGRPHPASELLATEAALARLLDAHVALAARGLQPPPVDPAWTFLTGAPVPAALPVLDGLDATHYPLYVYELRPPELPVARLQKSPRETTSG